MRPVSSYKTTIDGFEAEVTIYEDDGTHKARIVCVIDEEESEYVDPEVLEIESRYSWEVELEVKNKYPEDER